MSRLEVLAVDVSNCQALPASAQQLRLTSQRTCTPPGTSTTHLLLCRSRRMPCRVMGRMPHHQ